jgi:hypothetical protein
MFRGTNITCSLIALTSLLGLWPSRAAAQTTANPTRATFTASSDHNVTSGSGSPVVQSYEIGLYILGASQPFQRVSIGKPNPDGTGTITVDMTAAFLGWPVIGTTYSADVAAVGPGGTTRSALSNTFSFTGGGACSFTVSSSSLSVPANGGSYTTTVATTTGCGWTGVSNAGWITVTSGGSATGNGTVAFSVAANTSSSPRTGTLTIAGRTLTVTQAGTCNFTLTPTTQNVVAAGGAQSAGIATTSGCGWTAASHNTGWIAITAGSSGTGNGTVAYNVSSNSSTSSRTGTLSIGGNTLTVTQNGVAGGCTFAVSPMAHAATGDGGTFTTNVTTQTGCTWTTVSSASWITINSSANRTASGTATYTVETNRLRRTRTGTVTIAGQVVTITQTGGEKPGKPNNFTVVTN